MPHRSQQQGHRDDIILRIAREFEELSSTTDPANTEDLDIEPTLDFDQK